MPTDELAPNSHQSQRKFLLGSTSITLLIWTIACGGALSWNIFHEKNHTEEIIKNDARTHFNKDQAFRFWATAHGGVYVPTNERTPPNPHLAHIPERDIETPSGKQLTLMNPAYMVRQLMDEYSELYSIRGRIVSLKPFREQNTPDEWERTALQAFEQGVEEVFEFTDDKGESYLRLMRPMVTKEGCLKCHGVQGYKVGDIRGGVGVSIPLTPYLELRNQQISGIIISYITVWLLGVGGIALNHKRKVRAQTKQQHTYNALLENEQLYSDLYENAPDMYISLDAKTGNIRQCNQTTVDTMSYKKDEMIGTSIFNFFHPDGLEDAQKIFQQFATKGDIHDAELQLVKKDGSKIDVSLNISPVRDKNGSILFGRSTCRDITERKQDKEELIKVRHHLQNIIDSMPSMIVGVNKEGLITHWNYEAQRIIGINSEQAIGKQFEIILPQLSSEMESIKKAIRDRAPQQPKQIQHKTENENRYADVMIYPLIANAEVGAVIRVDDITDRVRMEQLMTQTEKMMSVGGLAAGMAHELNNPLGGMLQGMQNIRRRLSPKLEKNQEIAKELELDLDKVDTYIHRRNINNFIEGMTDAGKRAAEIVQNMLTFSRRPDTQQSKVDIAELIDHTLELASVDYDLKKTYDFRAIEIKREFDPDLPVVSCVRSEIQQVILNLLRNAAQALYSQRERHLPPCITVRTTCKGDSIEIEVEDNGPGIDEETCKRVFEPFFTTRALGEGTGLGLSVSYFIIHDHHNGKISASSTPGKRTTFTISLPINNSSET